MRWLRVSISRLFGLFRKRPTESDLETEMRSHLDMLAEEQIRGGMNPHEARYAARREFGGLEQAKELYREQRGIPFLETLLQDLHYALRMLRNSAGFTSVVVTTLALGIGANTAMFSLMNAVLLQSLPVRNPDELVVLQYTDPESGSGNEDFSYPMYQELRDRADVFSGVFTRSGVDFNLSYGGQSERARGELVSGNYYQVLGVRPWLGRLLTPDDDRTPGGRPVAVLSYGYWLTRFGGDTAIVGKEILLDARRVTVIGVTPANFYGTEIAHDPEIHVPMMMATVFKPFPPNRLLNPRHRWLTIMARRKPEISVVQAQAATDVLYHQILEAQLNAFGSKATPHQKERALAVHILLADGRHGFAHLRAEMQRPIILLFTVTAIVLLVACANIANLLLARSAKRRGEVAVRLAIGAGPGRLVRQWLTESIMLGLLGGAAGILFAAWLKAGLIRFLPTEVRANLKAPMDTHVLEFLLLASIFTGILFGLAPALQVSRLSVTSAIHDQTSFARSGERSFSLRSALIFMQVALSLPLLIGAGLFLHSLRNLRGIDPGYEKQNVFLANLNPSLNGYPTGRVQSLYSGLLDLVRALPEVRAASLTTCSPICGGWDQLSVRVEGYQPRQDEDMSPNEAVISPGYFETLGIPIVEGRDFAEQDSANRPKVVIVNQAFARYFFGDTNPLGKHMTTNDDPGAPLDMEIIAVVKDAKYVNLDEKPRRHFYTAIAQEPRLFDMTLQVKTAGDPRQIADLVRAEVRELDPNLPLYAITTLEIQIEDSLIEERLLTWLSSLFGMLATVLAGIGLGGVMAFSAARRKREIGIRVALGAQRSDILRLMVMQAGLPVGAGLAVGLATAFGLSRLLASMLYEVGSADPATFTGASLLLAATACLAAYLPARRATRVDPVVALRYE